MIIYTIRRDDDLSRGTDKIHWPGSTTGSNWSTYCGIGFRYEPPSRPVRLADSTDQITCKRCQKMLVNEYEQRRKSWAK